MKYLHVVFSLHSMAVEDVTLCIISDEQTQLNRVFRGAQWKSLGQSLVRFSAEIVKQDTFSSA